MRTPAFNKYFWLINLLETPHSLEEISDEWMNSPENSTGSRLSRSTFFYWKTTLERLYGITVTTCSFGKKAKYVIESSPGKEKNRSWLLNTASIENTLISNLDIRDRILLEPVPSCEQFLQLFLDAIHWNKCVSFDYTDYWEDPISVTIQPFFLKLFRQHWKVIGPLSDGRPESIRSYALDADRMTNVRICEEKFRYPDDFSPEEFMRDSMGTMTFPGKASKPKTIYILAWEKVNLYLESVPLHSSQITVERVPEDGYSIFQYTLYPSDDFYQELCRYQEYIEVLSPADVREEMKSIISRMQDEYAGISRASCKSENKAFEKYLAED